MISVQVPPLLMILGPSYAAHVTSEYHQLRHKPDPDNIIIQQTLKHMTLPVMLTGLTTIAGFIALMTNPISAVQEVGIFSASGVVCITILSITFTPALLKLLDRKRGTSTTSENSISEKGFDRFVDRIALFDLKHRRSIFVAFGLLFLLARSRAAITG